MATSILALDSDVLGTLQNLVAAETNIPVKKKRKVVETANLIDCDECDFTASTDASLRIHKLKHSGFERPLFCETEGCAFQTTRRYPMKRHLI